MDFRQTVRKNTPNNLIQPRRAQVYVGFQCHQRCGFCYYKSKCNDKMFDLEFVKKQIDFEYDYGIRDFEITGGEPSEYDFLEDVCDYIHQKDKKSKIAVITNGGLWKRNIWNKIDEVLISYHLSKNSKNYNKDMFPLGNTYNKVVKTIENAVKNDVLLRTNTVIGKFNMENLDDIVTDLIEFHPKIINFLPVNLFDEATEMVSYIDYRELRPILKKQLDRLSYNLPESLVFVRYMPFCDMVGYESHIVNHLQHIYDWFDWNRELDGVGLLQMLDKKPKEYLGRYGSTSIDTCFNQRPVLYEKSQKCMFCSYNIMCDGVESSNGRLLEQIVPQKGTPLKNPMYFIGDTTQKMYKNIYV